MKLIELGSEWMKLINGWMNGKWINTNHCWNDNDREIPKYLKKILPHWHFARHGSHMDRTVTKSTLNL
jgi:hypothetical protein